jgi:hypothetical protein
MLNALSYLETSHLLRLLIFLFGGHALCDYPLQGDFLSQGKNRLLKGIPWYQCLASHVFIHAAMVLLVTGSATLALAEMVIHALTDYSKGRGWINFNQDQAIHFACKILWAWLAR